MQYVSIDLYRYHSHLYHELVQGRFFRKNCGDLLGL